MSVYQAIIVVKGQSPMDLVSMSVRAGMEIMHQFDPTRSSYAGDAEHKCFKKDFDEWVKVDYEQQVYIAEDSDILSEIEFLCNMEGAPTSFLNPDMESLILVVGPFNSQRLDYFTHSCTKI